MSKGFPVPNGQGKWTHVDSPDGRLDDIKLESFRTLAWSLVVVACLLGLLVCLL